MRQFKVTERKTDRTDVLERYFSDISGIPILTPDEESAIAVRARNGDEEAKSILIRSNLRFVVSVAKSYSGTKYPLMDLISQGNIGLIESAETFDPSTGFKFISYAIWRIRSNILKYIQSQSRTVKIPQNVLNTMSEIKKIHDRFNQTHERDATMQEIMEQMEGVKDKTWISHNMDNVLAGIAADSFNIPLELRNGEDEDLVKAPISWLKSEESDLYIFEESERSEIVKSLLDCLDPIERKIVMDRMGKNWGIQKSFFEIGSQFDRSADWANKKFQQSIRKLKIRARKLKIEN